VFAPIDERTIIFQGEPIDPFANLWKAICMVESSNNPLAYHMEDNGFASIGIGQIQQSRLDDFNIKSGKNYRLKQMYDPIKAREVFYFYCNDPYNFEKISREWNGGTHGMRYKQTHEYYLKIQKVLLSL
jgi:hypothetical protein